MSSAMVARGKTQAAHSATSNGDAPSALLPAFAESTGVDLKKVNIVSTDAVIFSMIKIFINLCAF